MTEVKYTITAEDRTGAANASAQRGMGGLIKSAVDLQAILHLVSQAWRMVEGAVKFCMGEYTEALQAETKLTQVLKSTGNQLGLSTGYLQAYAEKLQQLTGFDDDLITSNMAMMATFTSIGKDVFPEAIARAADMTDMFGSMESATMQVGKALNEPIQGVSALRRVGVQLSDQQEELVKAFMAVNDKASAQKVILGELKKEFGGVAEAIGNTFVGSMRRLQSNIGDIAELIGEQAANFIKPWIDKINQFLIDHKTQITNIVQNLPELFKIAFETISKIIARTFEPKTFSIVFNALAEGLLKSFQTSLALVPDMVAALFGAGGDLMTIIMGNLTLAVNDWIKKTFNITSPTEEKERKKIERDIEAARGNISTSFGKVGELLKRGLKEQFEIWGKAAATITAQYTDIMAENDKKMNAIINKPLKATEGGAVTEPLTKAADVLTGTLLGLSDTSTEFGGTIDYIGGMLLGLSDPIQEFGETIIDTSEDINFRLNAFKYRGMGGYAGSQGAADEGWKPAGDAFTSGLKSFGAELWEAMKGVEAFKIIIDPLTSIIKYAVDFAKGAINQALQPLVGIVIILGRTLGAVLVPIFNALAPVLILLAQGFAVLYNYAIMPLANFIIGIINVIGMVIAAVVNVIIGIINLFGGHMKLMKVPGLTDNMLTEKINLADIMAVGGAGIGAGEGGGAGSQITGGRTYNIIINVYDPVIIDESNAQVLDKLSDYLIKKMRLGEEVTA